MEFYITHLKFPLACGRTLQDSSGLFSYKPMLGKPNDCAWRIRATHGETIVLNVTSLDLAKVSNCETDYLEVRDGHYLKSPLIGESCS